MTNYLVVTTKQWNIDLFYERTSNLPGNWSLISDPKQLTYEAVKKLNPRYVFFPHWSERVTPDITSAFECVCFHMTDVPYGRGGSPLQNLIIRGHADTKLTALRMEQEMDAGPVYCKRELSLSGKAQEIYERAAKLCYELIDYIVSNEPEPRIQEGEPVIFSRRRPDQSQMSSASSVNELYDFIRMLDADSYPRAFIQYGHLRLEFENALLNSEGELEATVRISKKDG